MKLSKRWKIVLGILGGGFLAFCLVSVIGIEWASRHVRELVMKSLQKQFNGQVQLDSIEIKTFPFIQVSGTGVVLHFEGREDLPPLISIKSFTAKANWLGLLRLPRHISQLTLVGLEITIPTGQPGDAGERARIKRSMGRFHAILMDDVHAENATLTILPKQAGKQPQVYDIASLEARSASDDGRMAFHATLRMPIPPGDILSSGTFGPWHPDAPGLTPVSGSFTYKNADLGHFNGIAGRLSAEGRYDGVIEKIAIDGTTDTPDFSVDSGGHPVDLTTTFSAIVDGANGDTTLQPVDAHFRHTTLRTTGTIAGTPGQKGKAVSLDVSATDARMEDILLLVVKDEPAMAGNVRMNAAFILPTGSKNDVLNRLFLHGSFNVNKVVFTNHGVEKKVDTLSRRSRGQTGDVQEDDNVALEMQGRFQLQNGVITFSDLGFRVPGARIHLVGTFGLAHQDLNLHGTLEMQASLSETTTGAKSFFLRAVNPLFSKPGGGTRIFFKIGGTAKDPIYGLNLHHKTLVKNLNQGPNKNSTVDARGN